MICFDALEKLPGYLDGAIPSGDHATVREHLDSCAGCRVELEGYRVMAVQLANIDPIPAPADLAVRIRIRASVAQSPAARAARAWDRVKLTVENIVRPLAVPATGGVLTAFVVFVLLVQNILVGVPLGGVVPNDLPLDLVQPARLESLAPFPMPMVVPVAGHPGSGGLLLEATLNSRGQVVFYKILCGPKDSAAQRQIDQVMLFSRFRPQLGFGRPMDGGRVLLSFSEVRVRG